MKPWIDRKVLIKEAADFIRRNGYFLRKHAKCISTLVEVAVYNSVVSYYQSAGYDLHANNLGPKQSFKFKLSANGLEENFSYFSASNPMTGETLSVYHNTKLQSAHHKHIYYTPDVSVTSREGAVTAKLKSGTRHTYIPNERLLSFVEVKHLPPFPEALFSFSGLVLEFMPLFISGQLTIDNTAIHLSPILVFTGMPSDHADLIKKELSRRYGFNIVSGTEKTKGSIADFDELLKYRTSQLPLSP